MPRQPSTHANIKVTIITQIPPENMSASKAQKKMKLSPGNNFQICSIINLTSKQKKSFS